MSVKTFFFSILPTNIDELILRFSLAILVLLVGILFGKLVSYGLRKLSKQLELSKHIRGSFIDLFLVIIRWSIYLIFINLGLDYLQITSLSQFFGKLLITLPAFTGALIILAIGFALAIYLREVIEDAEIKGWDLISRTVFFFVLYVFGVYAIRTALIPVDAPTTNSIVLILTVVISVATAYSIVRKSKNIEHIKELR